MIKVSAKYALRGAIAASTAALVSIAALSASGARQADPQDMRQIALADHRDATMLTAQDMFPDAPDGVDPMVTGPVSAAFRAQQQAAGCEQATWPRVPVECYPD